MLQLHNWLVELYDFRAIIWYSCTITQLQFNHTIVGFLKKIQLYKLELCTLFSSFNVQYTTYNIQLPPSAFEQSLSSDLVHRILQRVDLRRRKLLLTRSRYPILWKGSRISSHYTETSEKLTTFDGYRTTGHLLARLPRKPFG